MHTKDPKDTKGKILDFSERHPLLDTNVKDVVEWIEQKKKEGKINKLVVIIEGDDREVCTNTINMRNKDYAYFLTQELFNLFGRSD